MNASKTLPQTKKIAYTALFIAFGVVLPYFSAHAFGLQGTVLLPMHIPVLVCGLVCGVKYGLLCGALAPLLSSLITGMPVAYPMLPIMIVELSIYGIATGLLHGKFKLHLYIALPVAMVLGRVGYAIMFAILNALTPGIRALTVFAALATGLPGICIQLILVPAVVNLLQKTCR